LASPFWVMMSGSPLSPRWRMISAAWLSGSLWV
jgi:hypothetical protein